MVTGSAALTMGPKFPRACANRAVVFCFGVPAKACWCTALFPVGPEADWRDHSAGSCGERRTQHAPRVHRQAFEEGYSMRALSLLRANPKRVLASFLCVGALALNGGERVAGSTVWQLGDVVVGGQGQARAGESAPPASATQGRCSLSSR